MGENQQRSGTGASIIVQEVMEEEWTALQSENQRLPSLWGPDGMAEVGRPLSVSPPQNHGPFPPHSVCFSRPGSLFLSQPLRGVFLC